MSLLPHAALSLDSHVIPALKSFWPTFRGHFLTRLGGLGKDQYSTLLSLDAWKSYYAAADPLHSAIVICAGFSVYVYVMQEITGNASQVDGLWTFLPVIYTTHFTFQKLWAGQKYEPAKISFFGKKHIQTPTVWDNLEPRLLLIFTLQVIWSARLTYNAIRRGMFKRGEEDYRWPILRSLMNKPVWEIFTLTFIAIYQNILLACTALPSYLLLTSTYSEYRTSPVPRPVSKLTVWDWAVAALFISNLFVQFFADQQQWTYQNFKRGFDYYQRPLPVDKANPSIDESGKQNVIQDLFNPKFTQGDKIRGFVSRGLWAWSRHPNFACEQATWWILYLFVPITFLPSSLSKAPLPLWNYVVSYALASPAMMSHLFLFSTLFSEWVSSGKYPLYAAYKRRVGIFLPIDTALRWAYYTLVAGKAAKQNVEAEVWGDIADMAAKKTT